ncbi:unnamed protein product, partial [Ixodes pacificus]
HVPSTIFGDGGMRGFGKDMHGRCGEHTVVQVPLGTLVRDEQSRELAELDVSGARFLAARGGAGGRGNHHFLSNANRHPRVCQQGALGEHLVYNLEMKHMAHAGLVTRPPFVSWDVLSRSSWKYVQSGSNEMQRAERVAVGTCCISWRPLETDKT